ncbi:MAG: PHP domain-containing protein [Acidobacteriota bacterium]|nr:PHP domain-containing protein [Acidobacteriota bacterium]
MIDLHVHTDRSDGSTAPADLVRQARELGIDALGIADHDTLAGYDAACPFAAEAGLELVCAVELSTRPEAQKNSSKRERSVHVLGYFICSAPSPGFRHWLESQQASRRQRNLDLVAKLRQLGVEITLQDAEVYGRTQVGRPHFAKVLCDKGYVATVQDAFDVYLADDAQASVERDEPSLEEGIQWIREGGGFASLAHPVRLPQQGIDLENLVRKLRGTGLAGIEVYHSEHTPEHSAMYLDLARRLDLIPTGGSDFHGENKPGVRLGSGISGNVSVPYALLQNIREMCFARQ